MKLLIDIPEHIYEHAKETTEDSRDEFDAMRAIANGTQQESSSENPNTCGDAISRQAVLDAFWKLNVELSPTAIWTIQNMVKDVPSVSPQQRTGRWGKEGKCPFCGYYRKWVDDNFCGNCGAKMEVEDAD